MGSVLDSFSVHLLPRLLLTVLEPFYNLKFLKNIDVPYASSYLLIWTWDQTVSSRLDK